MKKRLLSSLLCLALLVGLLPAGTLTIHADWIEGGVKCWNCDTYDNPDEICDECGQHYEDCGSSPTHCSRDSGHCLEVGGTFCEDCGACLECILESDDEHCTRELFGYDTIHHADAVCSNCGACKDCVSNDNLHCDECHKCGEDDPDFWCSDHKEDGGHCNDCALWCPVDGTCYWGVEDFFAYEFNMCKECAKAEGLMCEEDGCEAAALDTTCGLCDEHAYDHRAHCPSCGECDADWCDFGGEHCVAECCVICDVCGECILGTGKAECPYCGLCEECCADVASEYGCSCTYVCVESSEWEFHFCEECGNCFDDYEKCQDCGLCEECCENNGCPDCGLCVESSDYDDHFCPNDCGKCLYVDDYCDVCGLCLDCCSDNSDCFEGLCAESDEYEDHFCEDCGACFHTVDRCAECEMDLVNLCVYDCTKHGDNAVEDHEHSFVENTCTICGIQRSAGGGTPVIIRQPSNETGRVTDIDDILFENDYENNTVSFHVRVLDTVGVTYQWQVSYSDKLTDSLVWHDLTGETAHEEDYVHHISEDECAYASIQFRCVVTSSDGFKAASKAATLTVNHYYGVWKVNENNPAKHALYCLGNSCLSNADSHSDGDYKAGTMAEHNYMPWEVDMPSTPTEEGLRHRVCYQCGHKEYQTIAKYHEHQWSESYDQWDNYHARGCTFTNDCMELHDVEPHIWGDEVTVIQQPTDLEYGVGEVTCTVCGFTGTTTIDKLPHTHDYEKNPSLLTNKAIRYSHDGGVTYDAKSHWIGCVSCGARYTLPETHTFELDYSYSEKTGKATLVKRCTECYYECKLKLTDAEVSDLKNHSSGLIAAPGCDIVCYRYGDANHFVTYKSRDYAICDIGEAFDVFITPRLKDGQAVSGWTAKAINGTSTTNQVEYFVEPDLSDDYLHFTVAEVNKLAGGISTVAKFAPTITNQADTIPVNRVDEPKAGARPGFANQVPKDVTIVSQSWEEVGGSRSLDAGGSALPGQPMLDTFEAGKLYRYTITLESQSLLYPITKATKVLLNSQYPAIDKQMTELTYNADGSLTASVTYSVKAAAMASVGALYVSDIFTLDGSTVLTGTVRSGSFTAGSTIYLYDSRGSIKSMTLDKIEINRRSVTAAQTGDMVALYVNGTKYPKSSFAIGNGISTSNALTFTDTLTGTLLNSGRSTAMANSYRPSFVPEGVDAASCVTGAVSGLSSSLAKGQAQQGVTLQTLNKVMAFSGLEYTVTEGGRTVGTFTVTQETAEVRQDPQLVIFGQVINNTDASGKDKKGNTWSYKASTRTLTLNGITDIPSSCADVTPIGIDAAIYCVGDLTIDTGSKFGSSNILFEGSSNTSDTKTMTYYGICVTGNLTVQGSADLNVDLDTSGYGCKAIGVYAGGSITWKAWGSNGVSACGPKGKNATLALYSGANSFSLQSPEFTLSAWADGMPVDPVKTDTMFAYPGGCRTQAVVQKKYDPEEGEFLYEDTCSTLKLEKYSVFTSPSVLRFYRYGDMNRDGLGTLKDVFLMFTYCNHGLGWDADTQYRTLIYADFTGDGVVNLKDVSALYRSIADC